MSAPRPLAVVGNVNVDLILGPAAPWPRPGTEIIVDHDELRVGGAAGNASLAWTGLGVPHQIAANVGADAFGRYLADGFGALAARWPREATGTTVSVGITHPDGERTFFTSRGHLPHLTGAAVRAMLDGDRLAGGLLLVCGTFLLDRLAPDLAALFDWADGLGIDIALDTGWPLGGWTAGVVADTRGLLPRCRHLLLNEIESAALAGTDDPAAAARDLAGRLKPGGTAVVKRGPHGALAAGPNGARAACPAPAVDVVDTIGAGDVFNAGYLAAVAAGRPLDEALAAGVAVASAAVSTRPRRYDFGTQP